VSSPLLSSDPPDIGLHIVAHIEMDRPIIGIQSETHHIAYEVDGTNGSVYIQGNYYI
jgi:hypothetical protein